MPNYGKQFETKFKQDWMRCFPDSFLLRLNDQVSGYKFTSSNICDFIGYNKGKLYLLECKSHSGASLPFSVVSQYDKLTGYVGLEGIRVGIVAWLYEKDICLYIPVKTITHLMETNNKSVGIRHLGKEDILEIPSVKKRVFMDSDYSLLINLPEGW